MDSPIRQQQKRNDYQRHKLFRKMNRRKKAKKEQEMHLAEKELKKRLRMPRYADGKESYKVRMNDGDQMQDFHFDNEGNMVLDDGTVGHMTLPEVSVRPDVDVRQAVERRLRKYAQRSEMLGWTNPISNEYYMAERPGLGLSYPEFDLMAAAGLLKYPAQKLGNWAWYSQDPLAQYVRYSIGKFKYGFDAEFPTLFRKIKGRVIDPTDGRIVMSNPKPRFSFFDPKNQKWDEKVIPDGLGGTKSPTITNMSYGNSVRSHSDGDWDDAYTVAFNGKELLGKRVVSTEPSDIFTYGDIIAPKTKDVTLISGIPEELNEAASKGINTATSKSLQQSILDDGTIKLTDPSSGKRFNLAKRDYSKYAKEMRKLERELYGDLRRKDVDFMNFVLRPDIEGKIYDRSVLNSLKGMPDDVGEWVGNSSRRGYLYDPAEYGGLIYDPHSPVESQWRKSMGIDLTKYLPQWQRDLYGHSTFGYKYGKASGIHIKPENRGKFTALKKRTGKSASWFKAHGTPAQKKMATFALNSRKWHHK